MKPELTAPLVRAMSAARYVSVSGLIVCRLCVCRREL